MVPLSRGKFGAWDVTCVDTMADSYIGHSHGTVAYAANEAERKKEKYRHLEEDNFIFYPAAFESMGPWGESAKQLVAEIGRRITEKTGEKRATQYLRQRISIENQRGSAISVLGTYEGCRPLNEVFCVLSAKH